MQLQSSAEKAQCNATCYKSSTTFACKMFLSTSNKNLELFSEFLGYNPSFCIYGLYSILLDV